MRGSISISFSSSFCRSSNFKLITYSPIYPVDL
ncbi:recombination, repair and ssDNA binding protein [Klebsiella phage vB_KpnM_VAC13]|nr:recombination, repair and ssDNA binding protein [Klebsiella phage vB_KpnM_VAC13]QYC51065.1 UvsY [Klebsiella phage vB_KpnM-VAC66]WMX18018.1 hypothetical protein [Klebsiella phage KpF2]